MDDELGTNARFMQDSRDNIIILMISPGPYQLSFSFTHDGNSDCIHINST